MPTQTLLLSTNDILTLSTDPAPSLVTQLATYITVHPERASAVMNNPVVRARLESVSDEDLNALYVRLGRVISAEVLYNVLLHRHADDYAVAILNGFVTVKKGAVLSSLDEVTTEVFAHLKHIDFCRLNDEGIKLLITAISADIDEIFSGLSVPAARKAEMVGVRDLVKACVYAAYYARSDVEMTREVFAGIRALLEPFLTDPAYGPLAADLQARLTAMLPAETTAGSDAVAAAFSTTPEEVVAMLRAGTTFVVADEAAASDDDFAGEAEGSLLTMLREALSSGHRLVIAPWALAMMQSAVPMPVTPLAPRPAALSPTLQAVFWAKARKGNAEAQELLDENHGLVPYKPSGPARV